MRVKKNKNGVWAAHFTTPTGRRVRKSLATRDYEIAKTFARTVYKQECKSDIVEPPKKIRRFESYAIAYMENGGERRFMFKILAHFGEGKNLDDIDELEMATVAMAIYPHASPETWRRQVYVPIKAVLNFANGNQRKKSTDKKRTRWLTPEEFEILFNHMDIPTQQKACFLVGTGCRTGEMFKLEMQDFWPATKQARIQEPKNGQERIVSIPSRAMKLLTNLPDAGALFRTPKGQPYKLREHGGGQMAVAFNKARDAAGFGKDVTPHVLRHTWATWFYAQTKDFGRLMDLGGWKKADMANRYRKLAPTDLGDRILAHGWNWQDNGNPPNKNNIISIKTRS